MTVAVAPVAGVALYEVLPPAPFLLNAALCLGLLAYALRSPALRQAKAPAEPGPDMHHH